jgi:hypothetical protein
MTRSGPILETLLRRLAETPPDFLDEPRIGASGTVHVPALVNDLLRMHGIRTNEATLQAIAGSDRNRLALVMIATWLLADEWFINAKLQEPALLLVLRETLSELATGGSAAKFVTDPDRREELVRLVLARCDYRPHGETVAQATDRLSSVSTLERQRLRDASRAAEQRAREIREQLAKKAAEDAADKWGRE